MTHIDKPEPSVAVIIVHYNSLDDTRECLKSMMNVRYGNYSIILVDNGSGDDPTHHFREEFPQIRFVKNSRNLGFTGGSNAGLKKAYTLGCKYIFLLNNDTVVSENILPALTECMEKNPRIGLLGPVNLYYHKQDTISFAGGWLNRNTGLVSFMHRDLPFAHLDHQEIHCNFVEGAALFMRSDLIREIGGFEDLYFLTSEESELCVRIADKGYAIAVTPAGTVRHKISRSMGRESELAAYFIFRNKLWFVKRNHSRFSCKDLYQLTRYYLICLLSYSLKKRNLRAAKGLVSGVRDFLHGVTGPGRFKNTTL